MEAMVAHPDSPSDGDPVQNDHGEEGTPFEKEGCGESAYVEETDKKGTGPIYLLVMGNSFDFVGGTIHGNGDSYQTSTDVLPAREPIIFGSVTKVSCDRAN
jgi:hypothetical protein